MSVHASIRRVANAQNHGALGVTIVMPCLNEIVSLPHCIANAQDALAQIKARYGLDGEVLIADNGSTDGSQQLAEKAGARVVSVTARGYGAALIGGSHAAQGRFLLMGDADGSYDFTDGVAMIGALMEGADLCMGSRFKGGIASGAMPWKNRYIGNPILTGILNLFFRSGVSDAHCGLRAITRDAFHELRLSGTGMEFASEMVIKASLKKLRIAEAPATLSKDLRDRAPHLRPWRDGWRHLRYLLMLSPTWVFGAPASLALSLSAFILGVAILHALHLVPGLGPFGASWTIVAGFLFTTGHFAAIMAVVGHLYGVQQGYRLLKPSLLKLSRLLTLETWLLTGLLMIAVALSSLLAVAFHWGAANFVTPVTVLPLVLSAITGTVGFQTIIGAFILAIVRDHEARFTELKNGVESDRMLIPSNSSETIAV